MLAMSISHQRLMKKGIWICQPLARFGLGKPNARDQTLG